MRVILDTNLWSYVAERGDTDALEAFEVEHELKIVIPPSILLEALRTPVDDVLELVAAAMTRRGKDRVHPLPEARLEADEVVSEVRRLRPSWLRPFGNSAGLNRLETFWTRRLWQAAARDPHRVAAALSAEVESVARKVLDVQRENRNAFLNDRFELGDGLPWTYLSGQPDALTQGWDGPPLESWRVDSAIIWWHALVTQPQAARRSGGDTSYADWAGAWLNLDLVRRDRGSFNRFWYAEAAANAMPRIWMRAVVPWVQTEMKIAIGNPRDAQHAAYLLDADLFITADAAFRRVIERVRPWCPFAFAETEVVSATGSTVEAIHRAIEPRLVTGRAMRPEL